MPTYTVLLAQDMTYYGNVSVEGDIWQAAVASLTLDDWDECYEESDGCWEQRVVHVEDEDGNILAEGLEYRTQMVGRVGVIQRLREIRDMDDVEAGLSAFINELWQADRHPVFKGDAA
jgi:hypothetical protein